MIFDRLFAATPNNPSFDINSPEAWDALAAGSPTSSGEKMSREKALTHAPWFRGINLVSNSVAKLHLQVYRNTPEGKVLDPSHPAWRLLRRKPNEMMTAFQFKKTLVAHALQEGNGYAYIFRNNDGSPDNLVLLDPTTTMPARVNGVLWYVTTVEKEQRKLPAEDVLHIRGLSFDGLTGYSVWDKARESLGLGMAAKKFGGKFFRNNARPNLAIEIPSKYDPVAANNLRASWEGIQGGLDNAHRIALLWAGQKLTTFSIDAKDAQLLETRAFETKEIALFIGIPSHKLGDKDSASYNSLEQENQDYLDEGLDPWLIAIEEEAWDKLLTEEQKLSESHEIIFNRKMLLRADRTAQANYLRAATGNRPWMTPDEARDEEDLPLLGGAAAELVDPPGSKPPVSEAETEDVPMPEKRGDMEDMPDQEHDEEEDDDEDAARHAVGIRAVVEDAGKRMTRRLGHAARAAAKKPSAWLDWIATLEAEHRPAFVEAFTPSAILLQAQPSALADCLFQPLQRALTAAADACTPANLAEWIDRYFTDMEATLPVALATQLIHGKPNEEQDQ